ncbi:DUF6362 family protein [Aliiruegeria sabulilitoris]|uniref:DUF6362 family protein n=1 Tax=Aliiruegeria sabulilitoris TaxID=1510458 RepID=UPI000829C7BD|nr:DUF6362 family protein [Aliiruegeria sabulilitoris]NDR55697.1 hypothetical protein [Pseudoruegeria sp. M32A2M]
MASRNLTPTEIGERFEEAALTLKRMPNPPGSGPSGYGSSWPAYVQEAKHAYGYHEARMRVVPNAAEIQRMEEALDWLRLINHPEPGRAAIDRRIVWMRADGHRWRTVCRTVGLGRSQAWRRWSAALIQLSRALGKTRRDRSGRRANGKTWVDGSTTDQA